MSKHVFRVRYELKWEGERLWAGEESNTVLAGDAERAIVACRKAQMAMTADYPDKEGGPDTAHRVTGFRLLGVESIVEIDILA